MSGFRVRSWLEVLARSWGRRPERYRRRRCWRPRIEELESRVTPNAYTVNLLGDSSGSAAGSSNGTYSGDLRYCLNAAIQDQQTDTITFSPTVFSSPQTITLSALTTAPAGFANPYGATSFIVGALDNITITGPAAGLTLDGGNLMRLFVVEGGGQLTLNNLTLADGNGKSRCCQSA